MGAEALRDIARLRLSLRMEWTRGQRHGQPTKGTRVGGARLCYGKPLRSGAYLLLHTTQPRLADTPREAHVAPVLPQTQVLC